MNHRRLIPPLSSPVRSMSSSRSPFSPQRCSRSAGPRTRRVASLAAGLVLAAAVIAGCAVEVSPAEASPFEPVTVDGGSVCTSGDTAVASSTAFESTVTLTRSDGGLQGRAMVADVPPGSYDVEVACEDGSTSRTTLEVTELPGPTETGRSPEDAGVLRWTASGLLAAGMLSIGVGLVQRKRAASDR